MEEMYRISYRVNQKDGASCIVHTYPILASKNTYFVVQSGSNRKHIKKEIIGEIQNSNVDRTDFFVFLTDLSNIEEYIKIMAEKVREEAFLRVQKFQAIGNMAIVCNYEIQNVEIE